MKYYETTTNLYIVFNNSGSTYQKMGQILNSYHILPPQTLKLYAINFTYEDVHMVPISKEQLIGYQSYLFECQLVDNTQRILTTIYCFPLQSGHCQSIHTNFFMLLLNPEGQSRLVKFAQHQSLTMYRLGYYQNAFKLVGHWIVSYQKSPLYHIQHGISNVKWCDVVTVQSTTLTNPPCEVQQFKLNLPMPSQQYEPIIEFNSNQTKLGFVVHATIYIMDLITNTITQFTIQASASTSTSTSNGVTMKWISDIVTDATDRLLIFSNPNSSILAIEEYNTMGSCYDRISCMETMKAEDLQIQWVHKILSYRIQGDNVPHWIQWTSTGWKYYTHEPTRCITTNNPTLQQTTQKNSNQQEWLTTFLNQHDQPLNNTDNYHHNTVIETPVLPILSIHNKQYKNYCKELRLNILEI